MKAMMTTSAAIALAATTAVWASSDTDTDDATLVTETETEMSASVDTDATLETETENEMTASADTNAVNSDPITMNEDWDMAKLGTENLVFDGWNEIDNEFTSEEITGMPLYDANDNWIGEVDNIIISQSGTLEGAVLGVGGFLGIGEKDVLVSFDSLKIKQAEDGDEMRVYVDVTKEQLEEMPNFTS